MKNRKIFIFEIIGFIVVCALQPLFHNMYDFLYRNEIAACFFPVNESVWEHVKIVYFPYILWFIAELLFVSKNPIRLLFAKSAGAVIGCLSLFMLHYTYSGIIGRSVMAADIISGIVSVLIAFIISYLWYKSEKSCTTCGVIAVILSAGLLFSQIFFTYFTPRIPLFRDETNGSYGSEQLDKDNGQKTGKKFV